LALPGALGYTTKGQGSLDRKQLKELELALSRIEEEKPIEGDGMAVYWAITGLLERIKNLERDLSRNGPSSNY